jgi:hypothetical protein
MPLMRDQQETVLHQSDCGLTSRTSANLLNGDRYAPQGVRRQITRLLHAHATSDAPSSASNLLQYLSASSTVTFTVWATETLEPVGTARSGQGQVS